jgi:mannose-1-phosphate guanylyltransferase
VANDNIFIVTNKVQKMRVKEQLPQIPEGNIVDEPFGKNTAACIGLAAVIIKSKNENAVMITLPADHLIKDDEEFRKCLSKAAEFAYKSNGLVTIGITPNRPETGYGYIQFDETEVGQYIHKVLTFAEKPNIETAQRFLQAGDFLWNSGIFIWRVDTILEEMKKYLPDLSDGLDKIYETVGTSEFEKQVVHVYGQLKSISIDYGVMEKSDKVFLTKADFYWNDLGNWEAVYEISDKDDDGNVVIGDVYSEKTYGSYLFSPRKFTAVIGVENLIIINTNESLLICHRNNAQDVRQIVDHLKMNKRNELV